MKRDTVQKQAGGTSGQTMSVKVVAFASAIGCTVEWYDFFIFGIFSGLVFNKLFFPQFDPLIGTLLAYTTFAIGFVARPIGGIIFGHFGDRIGRKSMLVFTLLIMGVATVLIGFLPTYAGAGVWAPIALLALRIFQGLGVGGEWGGAVLMATEYSSGDKRGFYGSWPQIGVPAGLALATGVVALLSFLPEQDFLAWGWRVAFITSALLIAVGLYVRLKIFETPAFAKVLANRSEARVPIVEVLRKYRKNVLLGMGARYIEGVCFNVYGVFLISYLTLSLKFPRTTVLTAVTIAAVVCIFFLPYFGQLSDRIGRRRVFIAGSLATGLLAFPAFWILSTTSSTIWLFLAIIVPFGIVYPAVYGPEAALFSELFDTRVRYTGISFVYQFSGIFASGLTPLIATSLLPIGGGKPWLIAGYMVVVSLISALCAYAMKEMSGKSIAETDLEHEEAAHGARQPA